MKNYLKILLIAVFLGGLLAFFFYKDIKNEVIAVTSNQETIHVFQTGVFKSFDNAKNFVKNFPSGNIYQDNDLYRVIIAVTYTNRQILESYFLQNNIEFYVKEIIVNEELLDKLSKYDEVIRKSTKDEVINTLNKSCVELFLKEYP